MASQAGRAVVRLVLDPATAARECGERGAAGSTLFLVTREEDRAGLSACLPNLAVAPVPAWLAGNTSAELQEPQLSQVQSGGK